MNPTAQIYKMEFLFVFIFNTSFMITMQLQLVYLATPTLLFTLPITRVFKSWFHIC